MSPESLELSQTVMYRPQNCCAWCLFQAWRAVHPPARGSWWLGRQPMVHGGFLKSWLAAGLNLKLVQRTMQVLQEGKPDAKRRVYVTGTPPSPLQQTCSRVLPVRISCEGSTIELRAGVVLGMRHLLPCNTPVDAYGQCPTTELRAGGVYTAEATIDAAKSDCGAPAEARVAQHTPAKAK